MIKGKRKLDNYLTNWCKANGFNVKCRMASDFEYDSNTNVVYYSLIIPEAHDKQFRNEVCKPMLKKDTNSFLLSLFHEIGHQKTEKLFSEDDMCDYYDMVEEFETKSKLTKRDYRKYYFNEIEYSATKWGCKYINNHFSKVNKMYEGLLPLIREFYLNNEVC